MNAWWHFVWLAGWNGFKAKKHCHDIVSLSPSFDTTCGNTSVVTICFCRQSMQLHKRSPTVRSSLSPPPPFSELCHWSFIITVMTIVQMFTRSRHHDSPANGQAVILLTGFLEVFVYIYIWKLDFGNSNGQLCYQTRQCWYGKHEHSGSLHSCTIIESDMPNEILMLIYVNVRLVEALILSFRKFEHFLCNCWVVEHLIKVSSQSRGLGSCWQNE